ncbi:MAG TPA: hypothetical protein VFV22_00370, partial [Candidatus Paceibacterota bacterium]|nr:hypothetical protein [Candidatus Paceibacterota bacterium]
SHEDPNRVKEKVYRTRIVALREELEKINNAVHDRTYEILRDSLFPGLTFTVSDRDAFIEQEVRQRESELRNIESLLQRLSMEGNSSASVPQPPSQEREIVEDIGVSPHISEAQPLSSFENVTARSGEESPEEPAQSVDVLDVNPHTENHTSFSPETKTTTPPSREEKVPAFDSRQAVLDVRFEHTFDISRTELETIEGFKSLSIPQQKLLYENFLQLTLGSVREDVAQLHAEHVGARAQEHMRRYGEKLGAVISGLQEAFTGTYKKLGAEKKQAHAMKTGGFETHKKLLTDLIHGMAAYGPRVHENIDGELMVDLVQIRARAQGKETRDAEWFAMNELNIVAHAYARIPSTWGEYTLGVDTEQDSRVGRFVREKILRQKGRVEQEDHKLAFETAHSRYEKAKGALEQVMRRSGKRDDEIAEMLMGIDMRVHQLQTLQTDPDALKALDEISHKNLFFESAKQMFSSSQVGYFALGFAGRSLLGSTFMGYMGAPMVSGAVASMRSWDKTAAELRERDRNARKGVVDGKEGALNIVIADHLISQTGRLIAQYRNATSDAERSKLLSSIQARATYIHDKQTLNRINYGNREGMVTKQVRLAEVLGEAMAIVSAEEIIAEQDSTKKRAETIRERLARKLDATEEQITHVRRVYRDREKTRSIGKAVAISLAGTFVSHAIHAQETKDAVTLSGKPLKPETFAREVQPGAVPEIHKSEAVYVIQKGDTLTDIMKKHVPEIKNLKTPFAQDNAVANMLKSLKPEELSRIGIRSGNPNVIYAEEPLYLTELQKIIKSKSV